MIVALPLAMRAALAFLLDDLVRGGVPPRRRGQHRLPLESSQRPHQ
jgi:hypothetical protein